MFNNRMLAVAAVLAMAVPALGAAAPIVVPPVAETLVEGHTVFTVIETSRCIVCPNNTTIEERFAAAVAVLVREYKVDNRYRDEFSRFPGVLWFNDQYLVNPENTYNNVAVNQNSFRYPCGGAVMAVNAGDPDPRMTVGSVNGTDVPTPANYAWLDAAADPSVPSASVSTDAVAGLRYDESYLITDPNDHVWIIDKYTGYSRVGTGGLSASYAHPVWVVNMLGAPVFVPDTGRDTCSPFMDLLAANTAPVACATGLPVHLGGPVRDNPCAGYMEPSRNGYCYGGQEEAIPQTGCGTDKPKRLYNALLYFKLEHLTVSAGAADHSDPVGSDDTNGCQVGTEWTCPGAASSSDRTGGNDDAEGNSHPFHPVAPSHTEREPCRPAGASYNPYGGTNPTNHGGSTTAAYDCDYLHAKRNIDVYFSGSARPIDPVVRVFDVLDLQGSTAPFQDFHSAYPGVTP